MWDLWIAAQFRESSGHGSGSKSVYPPMSSLGFGTHLSVDSLRGADKNHGEVLHLISPSFKQLEAIGIFFVIF